MKRQFLLTLKHVTSIDERKVIGYVVDKLGLENGPKAVFGDDIRDDDTVHVYGCDATYTKILDSYERFNIRSIRTFDDDGQHWKFVTKSNLEKLFMTDFDGDQLLVIDAIELSSGLLGGILYDKYLGYNGYYYVTDKNLFEMKQYAFDRDAFSKLFHEIIATNDTAFERLESAIDGFTTIEDFRIWSEDGDVYILHLPSGTLVNWYKFYHYGRANTCNKDIGLQGLKDFFMLLRHQLLDIPDEQSDTV